MKVKQRMLKWKIWVIRLFRTKENLQRPKNITAYEEWIVKIWIELLSDPDSKIWYKLNPKNVILSQLIATTTCFWRTIT